MALRPLLTSTLPWRPILIVLHEPLALQDAALSEREETFLAHKDLVFELEAFLAKSTSSKAILCSEAGMFQVAMVGVRADIYGSTIVCCEGYF